ncbi:protein DpdF [Sorangium sp. So ce134]
MFNFDVLARSIAEWPSSSSTLPPEAPGCFRRLLDAMALAAETPDSVGTADLAALAGQVLRRERHVEGGSPSLRVPRASPWPTKDEWRATGCEVTEIDARHFLVTASDWRPSWLVGEADPPPARSAIAGEQRRASARVSGDGFLSVVGLTQYSSPGQRQAMRTVLASRPGATILVNLPTGTGKSLVAHVPALLWSETGGTAIVVVPTTALALDQERAVQAYALSSGAVPERLAYYEGQPSVQREAIRQRIRSGEQRILFTSPESLVGALAPAVYAAAGAGLLRLLAIDEAHLVAQWGAEFRPEFQALSGLRRGLLRAADKEKRPPFRTVLLSATLTDEDYDTLHTLFGDPGPFEHVAAVVLRPEPSYWMVRCDDKEVRRERLLEAVRHLPRPMVVYASKPPDVETYAQFLRDHGIIRVQTVHGKTPPDKRLRVIRDWRGDDPSARGAARTTADVVVATSAFGLGVDQSDVRSVIHVCIPETIDRYYQEVGRGGRDGRACISLVLWTEVDEVDARQLNQRRVIGTELGYVRWEMMFRRREYVGPDHSIFRVSLDVVPPHCFEESDENRSWNVRTLALMARAGLIEFEAAAPPRRAPDESEEAWEKHRVEAFARYRHSTLVRLRDGEATDQGHWEARCEESRAHVRRSDGARFDTMQQALRGKHEFSQLFGRFYRVRRDLPGVAERVDVVPQPSCGGCPVCRMNERAPFEGVAPNPPPLLSPLPPMSNPLRRLFGRGAWLLVTTPANLDPAVWRRELVRTVERLVRHGIVNVIAPREVLDDRTVQRFHRFASERAVFLLEPSDIHFAPPLPTVFIVAPSAAPIPSEAFHPHDAAAPWIVIAPEDARDPMHPTARAVDVRSPRATLANLLTKI